MTKPDDIPQWAWDRSLPAFFPEAQEARERIARAIIAAVDEEREACAAICDNYGAQWVAEGIALSIRNRGAQP